MQHHHQTILHQFQSIKSWKRADQRAPHMPLLILLAIGGYTCSKCAGNFGLKGANK